MKKCMGCMRDYSDTYRVCPVCGYSESLSKSVMREIPDAIRPETILGGRFIIGKVLSDTPFAYVYISWDALLQRRVIIKEYFPERYASRIEGESGIRFQSPHEQMLFEKGRTVFEAETKTLNANQDLQGIVHVYRCLNENNTSYMVMEYLEGMSLQDYMDWEEPFPIQTEEIFRQLTEIVEQVHTRGFAHHNLSPDNIYLEENGKIRLLDFGNAKREVYQLSGRPMPIYRECFIAPEILEQKDAGFSADLYSLGAICYFLETGKEPPTQANRRGRKRFTTGIPEKDRMIHFLMEPQPKERPENIAQFRKVYQRI
ncbi:MAG: protein kinase [Lachnospiraceae bacterium]|nr:protein kinase [Lachnospiraceae bacterium]